MRTSRVDSPPHVAVQELGFRIHVPDGPAQGVIISTFLLPDDPKFDFESECFDVEIEIPGKTHALGMMSGFYSLLADQKCIIYPGKLTKAGTLCVTACDGPYL